MVQFRPQAKEIIAKIVYYGPPLGGKTTNLRTLYKGYPPEIRGELVVVPAGGDRTIFFDFLPLDAGTLRNMKLRVQLYTVPGQVHYNATRQIVLRGVDAVVFVADSQHELARSNRDSFEDLKNNLLLQGLQLAELPHVLQFNKRDIKGVMSIEDLNSMLNEFNMPFFEAVATVGIGVEETLQGVVKLVARSLRDRFKLSLDSASELADVAASLSTQGVPKQPAPPVRSEARVVRFAPPIEPAPTSPPPVVLEPRPAAQPSMPPQQQLEAVPEPTGTMLHEEPPFAELEERLGVTHRIRLGGAAEESLGGEFTAPPPEELPLTGEAAPFVGAEEPLPRITEEAEGFLGIETPASPVLPAAEVTDTGAGFVFGPADGEAGVGSAAAAGPLDAEWVKGEPPGPSPAVEVVEPEPETRVHEVPRADEAAFPTVEGAPGEPTASPVAEPEELPTQADAFSEPAPFETPEVLQTPAEPEPLEPVRSEEPLAAEGESLQVAATAEDLPGSAAQAVDLGEPFGTAAPAAAADGEDVFAFLDESPAAPSGVSLQPEEESLGLLEETAPVVAPVVSMAVPARQAETAEIAEEPGAAAPVPTGEAAEVLPAATLEAEPAPLEAVPEPPAQLPEVEPVSAPVDELAMAEPEPPPSIELPVVSPEAVTPGIEPAAIAGTVDVASDHAQPAEAEMVAFEAAETAEAAPEISPLVEPAAPEEETGWASPATAQSAPEPEVSEAPEEAAAAPDVSVVDEQGGPAVEAVALQRAVGRAITTVGEVRELEVEVPVPAVWTGGRRMTLQLRLTLVPQEEDNGS